MKKHLRLYAFNIQQILILPPNNWESSFCFGFLKEDYWVPHCKTLADLTPRDLNTEKHSSKKHIVTGKENSNLLYGEVFFKEPFFHWATFIRSIRVRVRHIHILIVQSILRYNWFNGSWNMFIYIGFFWYSFKWVQMIDFFVFQYDDKILSIRIM